MKSTKITQLLSVLLIGGMMSCGSPAAKENNDAIAKNKAAMLKVQEAFSTGNLEGLENYVAENMIEHSPDPMIKTTGLQGLKDAITTYRSGFPDMKVTSITMVAEGDLVIGHINMKGTNTGAMGEGMPATGKTMDVNGVDIVRFENGKGVEHWGYWEEMKMMNQLGLMPPPGGAPADTSHSATHSH